MDTILSGCESFWGFPNICGCVRAVCKKSPIWTRFYLGVSLLGFPNICVCVYVLFVRVSLLGHNFVWVFSGVPKYLAVCACYL